MNPDIFHHLSEARRTIERMTRHDFISQNPDEYYEVIINAARQVAEKALSVYHRTTLAKAKGDDLFQVTRVSAILQITDPVLLASPDYIGDDITLVELWCLSSDCYDNPLESAIQKTTEGDFVVFEFGEKDGPFPCSICRSNAWSIYIEASIYDAMPYKRRGVGHRYVMLQGVGEPRCDRHRPKPAKHDTEEPPSNTLSKKDRSKKTPT